MPWKKLHTEKREGFSPRPCRVFLEKQDKWLKHFVKDSCKKDTFVFHTVEGKYPRMNNCWGWTIHRFSLSYRDPAKWLAGACLTDIYYVDYYVEKIPQMAESTDFLWSISYYLTIFGDYIFPVFVVYDSFKFLDLSKSC